LILSDGAHPARADENAGASPNPAVVIAVFFKKTLRVVIVRSDFRFLDVQQKDFIKSYSIRNKISQLFGRLCS
jgi:hypothetical protein